MLPESRIADAAQGAALGMQTVKSPTWNLWYARLRRPAQLVVVLAFVLLPWANVRGWTRIYGSLFALNVYGVPFADPLSALQVLVIEGHFAARLWTGAALVLLMACVLGRFFCGWLCPYGLLSELVYALRRRLPPLLREDAGARHAYWLRMALCAMGLVAACVCAFPVLQRFSMPGELSLAPVRVLLNWDMGAALLAPPGMVLLVEGISGKRLWCRYACPQSVSLALAAQGFPGGFGVRWTRARCACPPDDRPCRRACSLGLTPRQKNGPPRSECVQCARCVTACADRGAALRIGL